MFDALRSLAEEKKQVRVTYVYRVVKRFGLPIRKRAEGDRFLGWMKAEGLAVSTQSTTTKFSLFYSKTIYITKTSFTNVSFNRRELDAFRQMEGALMCMTRLARSGCYKVAMEDFYFKHFPRR